MNTPKTAEEKRNEQVIRELYAAAEGAHKDTPLFVSYFAEGGYFYDVAAGKKYYGKDIGLTVDVYAAAFPDMHRELYQMYFTDDVVAVELSLNGTHNGDLAIPAGIIPPTHKEIHAPCSDVFHLKDGKVTSFHCYVAVPILLENIGVFMNLSAALKKSTDVAKQTYYAVDLIPVEHAVMTPDVIAKHTARLRELDNEGKLVLGGPFADDPGALLVLNCGDKTAAEAIMNVDPLIVSGVSTFRVHNWLIGNADNNYSPARTKAP